MTKFSEAAKAIFDGQQDSSAIKATIERLLPEYSKEAENAAIELSSTGYSTVEALELVLEAILGEDVFHERCHPKNVVGGPFKFEAAVWRADDTCSHCGGKRPSLVLKALAEGTATIEPSDKGYKLYIGGMGEHTKCYTNHFSQRQALELVRLLELRIAKIGPPGYLYSGLAFTRYKDAIVPYLKSLPKDKWFGTEESLKSFQDKFVPHGFSVATVAEGGEASDTLVLSKDGISTRVKVNETFILQGDGRLVLPAPAPKEEAQPAQPSKKAPPEGGSVSSRMLLLEANDLLRSAYQIAKREGDETNWDAFESRLKEALVKQGEHLNQTSNEDAATCTAKTFYSPGV